MFFGLVSAACGWNSSFGYLSVIEGGVYLIELEHDKKQQNDLCTQWRLWSAWASAQSDQSLLSALREARELSFLQANSKDSDQNESEADLSLRLPQRSFCWFCYVVAQLFSDIPVKSSGVVVPIGCHVLWCLIWVFTLSKICWIECQP